MDIRIGKGLVWKSGPMGTAVFSADGLYRYRLTRRWASAGPTIAWCMKNPSKAGADDNDMTVTKTIGYSKLLGASALVISNLSAAVSTDPKKLSTISDPLGPWNEWFLQYLVRGVDKIVAAWGTLSRDEERMFRPSLNLVRQRFTGVLCLGKTKTGQPRHPSRLAYETPWEALIESRP
jgi:hypothetical protein